MKLPTGHLSTSCDHQQQHSLLISAHREPATPVLCDSIPSRNDNATDQSINMLSVLGNPRQLAAQVLNFGMTVQLQARPDRDTDMRRNQV